MDMLKHQDQPCAEITPAVVQWIAWGGYIPIPLAGAGLGWLSSAEGWILGGAIVGMLVALIWLFLWMLLE